MTNKLILVGTDHDSIEYLTWQSLLMARASKKEIALGLEGVVRDESRESIYAGLMKLPKGFIFGIEHDLANTYTDTLIGYGVHTVDDREQMPMLSVQLLNHLYESPTMQNAWEALREKKLHSCVRTFYDAIDRYKKSTASLERRDILGGFMEITDMTTNNLPWRGLFYALSVEMTKEAHLLPKQDQPDFDAIDKYVTNPFLPSNQWKFADDVVVDWRDSFLEPNAKYVAKVAHENKVDAIVPVGAKHIETLGTKFGKTCRGLQVHIYSAMSDVPRVHWGI